MRGSGLRLAQVANFVSPASGGLRIVVEEIGRAHLREGGERLLLVPAQKASRTDVGREQFVTLAGPWLPASGHEYRVLLQRRAVVDALESFRPDVVEVHDQTTLAWVADWARDRGVPSVLFSHERLDLVVGDAMRLSPRWLAHARRSWSAGLAGRFDAIVCASAFAAEPFAAIGAGNVHRIPFGVDLECFTPRPGRRTGSTTRRLVCAGRLHREKAPQMALDAVAQLCAAGEPVELLMLGRGPLEGALRERCERDRLPVRFVGHLGDRARLGDVLAGADVVLAPGPRETFGLSILEAMACATPVVVSAHGAAKELVTPGTGIIAETSVAMADAVRKLLGDAHAHDRARELARRRAEQYSWAAATTALSRLRSELMESAAVRPGGRRRPSDRVMATSRSGDPRPFRHIAGTE
jgi:alpha-1,6-mannosyltransferase